MPEIRTRSHLRRNRASLGREAMETEDAHMGDLGFWAIAREDPDHLALVEPDGSSIRAGELLGRANQLVHGLREFGLRPGESIAMVLPNCAEVFELYLAVLQAGWYLVPINHHLVGPEIAYIVQDCEARVFVGHQRFADGCRAAATQAGHPPSSCFMVHESRGAGEAAAAACGSGFRSFSELKSGQPTELPPDRTAGAVMNYTSGTTGRPKGVRRALLGVTPEAAALGFGGILMLFGIQPDDGNVHLVGCPLYHTAVLTFSGASIHLGHTLVVMDKWTPESCLEVIEKQRVTTSHMVPTQFHRLLALPAEVRSKYDMSSLRHMIHAAAPCPPEVKRQMIDWWGAAVDEYYAASEGGGTVVTAEQWLNKPGTVGTP
jgi:long-chain acyl-CoA synthetase